MQSTTMPHPFFIGAIVLDFQQKEDDASLPRVYSLLANLQLERARSAPKMIMSDSRESHAMILK
jgi:hypothetical protein